jgi:hypothetical protein
MRSSTIRTLQMKKDECRHVARVGEMKNVNSILVGNLERNHFEDRGVDGTVLK